MGNLSSSENQHNAYFLYDECPKIRSDMVMPQEHVKTFSNSFEISLVEQKVSQPNGTSNWNRSLTNTSAVTQKQTNNESSNATINTETENEFVPSKLPTKYTAQISAYAGGYIINNNNLRREDLDYYIHQISVVFSHNPLPCPVDLVFRIKTREHGKKEFRHTLPAKKMDGEDAFVKKFNNFPHEKQVIADAFGRHHMIRKIEEFLTPEDNERNRDPFLFSNSNLPATTSNTTSAALEDYRMGKHGEEFVSDKSKVRYYDKHLGIGFKANSYMPVKAAASKIALDNTYNKSGSMYDFNRYKVEGSSEDVCFNPEGLRIMIKEIKNGYLSSIDIADVSECKISLAFDKSDSKKIIDYILHNHTEQYVKEESSSTAFESHVSLPPSHSSSSSSTSTSTSSESISSKLNTQEAVDAVQQDPNANKSAQRIIVKDHQKRRAIITFTSKVTYYTLPKNEDFFCGDFPFHISNETSLILGKR